MYILWFKQGPDVHATRTTWGRSSTGSQDLKLTANTAEQRQVSTHINFSHSICSHARAQLHTSNMPHDYVHTTLLYIPMTTAVPKLNISIDTAVATVSFVYFRNFWAVMISWKCRESKCRWITGALIRSPRNTQSYTITSTFCSSRSQHLQPCRPGWSNRKQF